MRRKGFTLLEVLLTLVLLVIVLGVLHSCLGAILRSTEHGRAIGRVAVEGRNLLAMLESDLRGALLLPDEQSSKDESKKDEEPSDADKHAFVAEERGIGGERIEKIRFVTNAPLRGEPTGAPRTLRLVTYSLTPAGKGCFSLTRSVSSIDGNPQGKPMTSEVTDALQSIALRFTDGKTWTGTWNSRKTECLPRAAAIDLVLSLADKPGQGAMELSSAVAIPLGCAEPVAEETEGKPDKP